MRRSPVILLAGGNSTRAGIAKGAIPFQNRPWLLWQLDQLKRAEIPSIVIVLGFRKDEYRPILPTSGFPLSAIKNPHPEKGQFSSIKTGLGATERKNGVFLLPIDTPAAEASTWKLLEEESLGKGAVIPSLGFYGGHPIWLSPELCDVILSTSDGRLDLLVKEMAPDEIARVEVADPRVILNLNTVDQFQEFEKRLGRETP